jgi:thiol:disulfide interchange protein DsbD
MPKLHTLVAITAATLIHAGTPAAAVPVTYTDEASFNAALAALGASARHEGFEDDAVFGGIRAGVKAKQPDGSLVVRLSAADGTLPSRLQGVLRVEDASGARVPIAIDAELAPTTAPAEAIAGETSLLAVLGLALLGGLVLNLMPCVLPVLAMKVFSVGELGRESRSGALRHGLAYAGGVELSLLSLACVALALRGAGHAVGWGFQFQEPAYVTVISAVLVGFALNLFGVFEIGFQPSALAEVGADATGARRSFFEGLLAVALATPCSAPFLGTALGFAFASSAWVIVAVFLTIGAGLALPFVAISAFPTLARFMPRSGKWMGKLRAGLGFALLATVVWLLWIVGRSAGTDAVAVLLGVLLTGAFVAWIYGQAQELRFAGAVAALAVAILVVGGVNAIQLAPASASHAGERDPAWSRAALGEALAAGRPAFVYFSADWCLTCKLNERVAIETPATRERLRRGNYAVLHGDWTQRDETIRAELATHGKAGVPLYLVYSPLAPSKPQVLPELITEASLAEALERAVDRES